MTTITNYANAIALSSATLGRIDTAGTSGNAWIQFASSSSWGAVSAGGSAVYQDIILNARDFTTDGYTDTATITAVQIQQTYDGGVSSPTVSFLRLLGNLSGAINFGETATVVPRGWTATNTNAYVMWGTTGTSVGQVWLHVDVSTCDTTGVYTMYEATNTAINGTQNVDTLVTSTFVITGLTAGQNISVHVTRPADGCKQDVYVRSVDLGKN